MEIEVRARINDASKIKDLLQTKAEFVESSNENDLYLRHESDVGRSLVLRIRRKENGSFLTFKGKSKGDDTAWPDVDLPLSHPDDLENLLLGSDYIEVVRINKHRSTYREQDFEINLDEIDTINYLSYVDVVRYNNLKIDKAIINKLNFCQNYCLILFGSFASGKQRADSDIDICFLIGTDSDKKRLLPLVENAKLKSLTDLHIHYISLAEFEEMLIAKEENLGKQIFRNSVVAFNHMTYFNVLKEAVYHGFKG